MSSVNMNPADVYRLGKQADRRGVRLYATPAGETFARSTSASGVIYRTTPTSCDCKGFAYHGRCQHIAKLVRS